MRALIALDGSPHASKTLAAVGPWARAWGVEVHLLQVINPDTLRETSSGVAFTHALTPEGTASGLSLHTAEPLPALAEDRTQAFERARIEHEDHLRAVANEHMGDIGITIQTHVSHDVAGAIVETASREKADLIVVGTHGRTGISHAILGSVAEAVIRQSPVPVLVVGPNASA